MSNCCSVLPNTAKKDIILVRFFFLYISSVSVTGIGSIQKKKKKIDGEVISEMRRFHSTALIHDSHLNSSNGLSVTSECVDVAAASITKQRCLSS